MATSFNGTTSFCSVPLVLSGISPKQITVTCWLNWTTFANNDSLAMEYSANSNSNDGTWWFNPNDSGTSGFSVKMFAGGIQYETFTRPTAGVWHHYAATFDGTQAGSAAQTVYLDGVSQSLSMTGSPAIPGSVFPTDQTLYVMSRAATSLFGAGAMSRLAIYPTILSGANVASLAACANPLTLSPLYYWTMDNGAVSTEANLGSGGTAALTFTNTGTVADPCAAASSASGYLFFGQALSEGLGAGIGMKALNDLLRRDYKDFRRLLSRKDDK